LLMSIRGIRMPLLALSTSRRLPPAGVVVLIPTWACIVKPAKSRHRIDLETKYGVVDFMMPWFYKSYRKIKDIVEGSNVG
ncbi:MAG: hypothetical protein KDE33_23990, partial [Bacteroidetes bacterium]|nr:hypothetical protein [Bacteroidota bacterium]